MRPLPQLARFLLIAILASARASPKQPCLDYQPQVVELTGVMRRHGFPGPPNYQSVAQGDALEVYWLLHLARPIQVGPGRPADPDAPAEANLRALQILLRDYRPYLALLGKRVTITGTLSHAITGHHHTTVVIDPSRIELAPALR